MTTPERAYRGGAFLAYAAVVAVFLWLYLQGYIYSWDAALDPYNISIYAGVVAYVVFMTQFLLAARIVWIERLLGQDMLLRVHGFLGVMVFGAIAVHGAIKFAYIGPSGQSALGVAAAFVYIILTPAAILILQGRAKNKAKLPRYETVKAGHNLFVLAALLAVAHVQLASSTYSLTLRIVTLGWAAICLGAYINHKFIRPRRLPVYRVTEVDRRPAQVVSLALEPTDGHRELAQAPGQFAYFRFASEAVKPEEHPFTIASAPDRTLRVIARQSGDFTTALSEVREGDTVRVDGPYGRFTPRTDTDRPLYLIAGGIGITPMLAMASDVTKRGNRPVTLVWSVRSEEDMQAVPELSDLTDRMALVPHVTGNGGRRLDSDHLREYVRQEDTASGDFYVCGPAGFIDGTVRNLRRLGVPRRHIRSERFSWN